jgi:hypothetical protein
MKKGMKNHEKSHEESLMKKDKDAEEVEEEINKGEDLETG